MKREYIAPEVTVITVKAESALCTYSVNILDKDGNIDEKYDVVEDKGNEDYEVGAKGDAGDIWGSDDLW